MKLTICIALLLCAMISGCVTNTSNPVVETAASSLAVPPPADLTCEPYDDSYCDPSVNCEVSGQYVQCFDGLTMYAWQTPDCRWCVNRDVCASHSGPWVCPF